jgi:hypothetical protein
MKKFNQLRLDLVEKTLTPAEKKKREEIAMAMERENPGMPVGKKMAIATATAKRVAEENLDELKTDTLDSYITKVATGPSRGNTQTGIPKSIKAIGGTTTAIRKKIENAGKKVNEEIKTTYEDPLVVTKDSDGNIHTHANLSVANAIHGTDVKHQAIHTGMPVQAGKFTFQKSMHHDSAVKEAKEKTEYDYEGDMARSQLQSIVMNAQKVHDMLKDNDNLPEWVQSKITLAEDYILTVSNYMATEIDEQTNKEYTHKVVNRRGDIVGKYTSLKTATRAADKKDNAYGGYAHQVRRIDEKTIEEASYTFEPATHKPTVKNSKGHSFEGNTYNAKGLKGASIYKNKDTGKYYANKIDSNTTFHSSAEDAAEKYHNKAK